MIGVYIHIPFCNKICNYCDFCKILYDSNYVSRYLDSLEKEIHDRYKGEIIKSIYIGGGTPSSLSIDELDRLFSIITIFNLDDNYEYTVECNIESIDVDKINIFKSYGVNRISFGVESFNKDIQKILGRSHNEDMIFDNIYLTKKYFDNINIDLIYGVNDNIDIVKYDISKFLELDIPHISCYSLILEEHTKLYIDGYKYTLEDIDSDMYNYISSTLNNNGYKHYEISNYCKDGYESIHNKNYWLNGSYYGFGLSAVSYLNNYRISNTKNMSKYLKGNFIDRNEYEDINIQKENDLILGLRMIDGINIDKFNKKYNDDLLNRDIIKELIDNDYLIVNNNYIMCNKKYLYLENYILEKIIGSEL